jgi:peroxiredoxin Q/BCP
MAKSIHAGTPAPDFELVDTQGKTIRLSDYRGNKIVVLVLNRGFI